MIWKLANCSLSEGIVDVIRHIVELFIDFELGSIGLFDSFRVLVITDNGFMHFVCPGNLAHAILFGRRMLLLLNIGSDESILAKCKWFLRLDLIVKRKRHEIDLLWYDFLLREGYFCVLFEFHSGNCLQLAVDVLDPIDKEKLLLFEAVLQYLFSQQFFVLLIYLFL